MSSNRNIILKPNLPKFFLNNCLRFYEQITSNLNELRSNIHSSFSESLDQLIDFKVLKSYKDISQKYSSYQPSCYLNRVDGINTIYNIEDFTVDDFQSSGFMNIIFLSYELNFFNDQSFGLPDNISKYTVSPSFINVPKPWEIYLVNWSAKKLKSISKYKFGFWVQFAFPINIRINKPIPSKCNHDFNLYDLGVWGWRLIWKCKICGYICHCKCFEKAIKNKPFTDREIRNYKDWLPIDLTNIPFLENACDVCRNVPSKNDFCHEMYARSIFEQRYGAYIEKEIAELDLDESSKDFEIKKIEINNKLRKKLGFREIGERFVTETELFRIIQSLYPKNEVIHHYRDKWLQGLELDIYIPNKRLGIEYHGIQHFESIEAWGGEDALKNNQKRDAKKISLCQKKNVTLVVFTYEDEINISNVKNHLNSLQLL